MFRHRRRVGKVDYRHHYFFGGSLVSFREVEGDALADQLVAFAGGLHESLSVKHDDLSLSGGNQAGLFKLSQGVGNCRAAHSQHFGEQGLRDLQDDVIFCGRALVPDNSHGRVIREAEASLRNAISKSCLI